ncbi:DUF6531 domain-containing protein [Streptomyces fildesensis]|uniref:DUF6531 domain-containing protein n=1 Tax=Streptomyces fildesensis TaxID=375757 RepID=A0ABW8C0Q0_9ACTN
MTNRPTDWHVLDLDRDPVPGDPYEVKELAHKLGDFADDVSSALRSVKGLSGNNAVQDWAGLAADAYREQFGDLPGELDKLERSYRLASGALGTYWPKLETAQADADRALAQGRTARQDLDAAKTTQTNANDWVKRAGDKSKEYQGDPKPGVEPPSAEEVRTATRNALDASNAQKSANTAVHDAQQRLDAAKELAAQAAHLRDTAASTAEHALHEASDAGIKNKHWWEKAVDWVADHWDEIVAVCKVIVAVLGILVMIIGGPLAWIVLAAALVVLADTLIKYAQGKASLWDVLFAAMDCIPGFKGLTTAGGLLKMAKSLPALLKSGKALENLANGVRKGATAVRQVGKDLKDGFSSLRKGAADEAKAGRQADGKCLNGDPVDMITGEMLRQERDVDLPGLLPLSLKRTHLSSYRSGGWFGPSWASTIDQRLEADGTGITFAAEDGMILVYPVPGPGVAVLPTQGPRWPLEWDGTPGSAIRITDPVAGQTRHFAPLVTPAPEARFTLPLRAISDRNGHRIEFDRADDGTPTAIRHSGGYRLTVDTSEGRITALRPAEPLGPHSALNPERDDSATDGRPAAADPPLRSFRYSTAGDLTEVVDAAGRSLHLEYDSGHRITRWTDRNDSWYRFEYDEADRCVRGEGADGFLDCTIAYDPRTRTTSYTDSLGRTTVYRYNERLQLTSTTDPLGRTTYSEWDLHNRLLASTDPLGRTNRRTYDETGNLTSVIRADGTSVSFRYNELNRPVASLYPGGARWEHTWDERGNLLTTTDPQGGVQRYEYDARGHLTSVTDPAGNTRYSRADAAGLVVELTDPAGAVTRFTRDFCGRVTRVAETTGSTGSTGAAGTTRVTGDAVTLIGWTPDGKPAWRTFPDGADESWTYDPEGRLVAHRDASGGITRFDSTHFGLRSARTAPDGTTLRFAYDTELRLRSVVNAQGLTWDYEYDPAGRLIRENDFNGRTLGYRLDAAGQLVERVNGAGQTIRFTRDIMGRVVGQEHGDSVTSFTYDAAGRVLRAVNADADVTMERDATGRLVAESCNGRSLTNTYDVLGRRTGRRTPSGLHSSWNWRPDGRPTELSTAGHTLGFSYDAEGHEVGRRLGGTATLVQSWDGSRRLTEQTVTTGVPDIGAAAVHDPAQVLQRRIYSYRADGYVTAVEDLHSGSSRYELDAVGRVTAVRSDGWTESYAYDGSGNVSHAGLDDSAAPDSSGERAVTGTLIRSAGRTHYAYDDQGRVVRRRVKLLSGGGRDWHYTWSADDRLTDVITPDGSHWHYLYDALGRRIAKQLVGADGNVLEQTDFCWDGSRLAEQSQDGRTTTWDWAPGSHRVLSQTERTVPVGAADAADATQPEIDARFYAIVTDVVGTPTELVDPDGSIAWRHRTTLWGAPVSGGGSADCPLRFPGQYHDDESGLHYNLFRYYSPETAAYLSPDPLGLAPAPNHHAYISNPLTWIDPLGLECGDPVPSYAEVKAKALRDAGVPEGQEPWEVREWVPSTGPEWQGSPQLFDAEHNAIYFREEDHLTESGDLITFQDHHTGHREPGDPGRQEPHVHVRPADEPRNGQLPGCEEHYYYDPSLGKPVGE